MKHLFLWLRLFCCMAVLGIGHTTARGNALDATDAILPPFVNANTLAPATAQVNDGFGRSLAISHDTAAADGLLLAVGAPLRDVAGQADQGAVFLYRLEPDGWMLEQVLTADDGRAGDQFGVALALNPAADTLIVGAPLVDAEPHRNVGTAYIFHYADGVWQQTARLDPLAEPSKSHLLRGQGVALVENGQTAFVGAPGTEVGDDTMPGVVHVFTLDGGTWMNSDNLQGPTDAAASMGNTLLAASNAFGGEVGLLAAGLYREDGGTVIGRGIVHVYRREAGSWTRTESLAPALGFEFDEFGEALAMTHHADAPSTLVLIGSPRNAGSVYLYAYVEESWSEVHRFTPPDIYRQFGSSVALTQDGRVAAIGAPLNGGGAVHIYVDDPEDGWRLAQTVLGAETGIRLGETVTLSPLAGHLLAGAPATTMQHTLNVEGGALHVYIPGTEIFLPLAVQ